MNPAITPHAIRVRRTARYFTLGPTHGFPRELWVVCHGYGQLAQRFLSQFAVLDDGTRLIVAPEALSRFYLDPLAARRGQDAPRIVVLGFSQGTATVCRWLAASELRADEIVLWAGSIPPELDVAEWAESLHGAKLSLVAGESDELVTANAVAAEGERLSAAGVAFTLHRYAGGHRIDEQALSKLADGFEGH
jgi:DNA-binding transcriptional LysR family regulator